MLIQLIEHKNGYLKKKLTFFLLYNNYNVLYLLVMVRNITFIRAKLITNIFF